MTKFFLAVALCVVLISVDAYYSDGVFVRALFTIMRQDNTHI